jgi:hypothetical protein
VLARLLEHQRQIKEVVRRLIEGGEGRGKGRVPARGRVWLRVELRGRCRCCGEEDRGVQELGGEGVFDEDFS